jgi:hypothetical protein
MDKSISAGDLVMVVKPPECGCPSPSIGLIRTVERILPDIEGRCPVCEGGITAGIVARLAGPGLWDKWHIALHRLKKIDPLSEPESIVERLTVNA